MEEREDWFTYGMSAPAEEPAARSWTPSSKGSMASRAEPEPEMDVDEALDQECPNCDGTGKEPEYHGGGRCYRCDGSGFEPTAKGQVILDFLKRQGFRRIDVR